MHDTAAVGRESESAQGRIWFLPSGAARGERNTHRAHGWVIAVSAAVLLWAVIGIIIAVVVSGR